MIRRENGVTRADLGLVTGLSRSAIAEGVQDLLDDQLVAESVLPAGGRGTGRGRPSALLVPAPGGGVVAGIDFGHAHVAAAVADTTGTVLAEKRTPVDVDNQPEAALDAAAGMIARLVAENGLSVDDVRTVAAGVPAPIDTRTQRLRPHTLLEKWQEVDPVEELRTRLNRRVVIANDAEMGAIGEVRFGAGRGMRDVVYAKVSEGLGASLLVNGVPLRGSRGLAGEIGHIRLHEQAGTWCRCGNRGCLETVLSTNVVEARFREVAGRDVDPVFPLRDVVGDPVISGYVLEASRTLGRVIADLCNWVDPQAVIVGGVLGTAGEAVVGAVRESIARSISPMLGTALEVRTAHFGLRSELMGAVATACQDALCLPTATDASP